MEPVVSVVMAVRNGERYVVEALASVLNQSLTGFEVVVINDGSTDHTAEILEEFRRRDQRVLVMHQEPVGLTVSLIRGLAAVRGRYVARQDADDWSAPERLERQVRFLDAHPTVAALGTGADVMNDAGAVIGAATVTHGARAVGRALRCLRATPVHGSVMMRRDVLDAVGGYRLAFAASQDLDLWLRMAERGAINNLPERLYRWRLSAQGVYATRRRAQLLFAGVALAFAEERRRYGADSYERLVASGGNLDAFAAGYRLRELLWTWWGKLLYRGLDDSVSAHRYLAQALRSGWVRPTSLGLYAWAACGLPWPGRPALTLSRRRGASGLPRRPRVLMVTGAYYPELSGGGLQCRDLVLLLQDRVQFAVLTTTTVGTVAQRPAIIDGIPVHRVPVDVTRPGSIALAAVRMAWGFLRQAARFDIVHLHGFSRKALLLTLLAKGCGKRVYLTLHTGGHDEAETIRRQGRLLFWAFRHADRYSAVSPQLREAFTRGRLPIERCDLIPNGIDVERFRPAEAGEQAILRTRLGLPASVPLIVFIGFFSHEKRPHVAFEAWTRLLDDGPPPAGLVLIGATRSRYFEVDEGIADRIRQQARNRGVERWVIFVEQTDQVPEYLRAADVFVLPTSREGHPRALLEAMASGLPCIVTRLPGVTDVVIEHGMNGLLVPSGDVDALSDAITRLLADPERARAIGQRARATVEERYAICRAGQQYLNAYHRLLGIPKASVVSQAPDHRVLAETASCAGS